MKVRELIELLERLEPEKEIMILDGANGGGDPREIDLGPSKGVTRVISYDMWENNADCEAFNVGTTVYVMGYGFY